MNIISLANTVADATYGAIVFKPGPKTRLRSLSARLSRTETLDGGAVIDHQGVQTCDLDFYIQTVLSKEDTEKLWGLYTNNTFLALSTEVGAFYGAVSNLKADGGSITFVFHRSP